MKLIRTIILIVQCLQICLGESHPMSTVWSKIGDETQLPCNLPHFKQNEKAILYLWFKNSNPESVYSFDARNSTPSNSHWFDEQIFGRRASFNPNRSPPVLLLDQLVKSDEGVYTCRVEFKRSPSSFTSIRLSIIESPEPPVALYDGNEVLGPVGPIFEGDQVKLTCLVRGGKPNPEVVWWIDNVTLPSEKEHQTVGGVTDTYAYLILTASRRLHGARLICRTYSASPSNISVSAIQHIFVHLNIILSPISVKLSSLENPISERTTVLVVCRVVGSSPPSHVTLFMGEVPLTDLKTTLSDGGNISLVTATIHVSKEDNGKTVACRATNRVLEEHLQLSTLTDIVKLNVYYSPIVIAQLNKNLEVSSLKEGQDALLQCLVQSNPPPHRIDWFKDNNPLKQNGSYILSKTDLALQKLDKSHSGSYSCAAENLEGKGISKYIEIHVRYAPVCASREHGTQGIAIGHSTNISCLVDANPADNVIFTWTKILPTGREKVIPVSNFSSNGLSSTLTVYMAHIGEFGDFLCRGSNIVGKQKIPCIKTLVPAGPPYTLKDCSSLTDGDSLAISCEEGFNGGIPQEFYIEIFEESELLYSVSNKFPMWSVGGLEGGKELDIVVWSENSKGKSPPITMFVQMPTANQQSVTVPEGVKSSIDIITLYGAIVGTLLVIATLTIVIFCIVLRRYQHKVSKQRANEIEELQSINARSPDVVNSVQERSGTSFIDLVDHSQGTTYFFDQKEPSYLSPSSSTSTFESDSDTSNPQKIKIVKLHVTSKDPESSITTHQGRGHVSDDGTVHAFRGNRLNHTLDRNYRRPRLKKQLRNSVLELASDREILELLLRRSFLRLSSAKESAV